VLLGGVLLSGLLRGAPISGASASAGELFSIGPFARAFMDRFWLYFALAAVLLLVAEIAASAVLEIRRRSYAQAATEAKRDHG
jgi:NADH-quinone oxidoreductase subunit J